jgi:hypothetical protein
MYRSAGQPGGGGQPGSGPSAGDNKQPDGDVIDAEYVDGEEKK